MSDAQLTALAARKARLLERIDAQRSQLATCCEPLKKPFELADKLVAVSCYVRQRPWIAGVGVALAVLLRRRNVFRWVGRGWTVWRGWQFARRWLTANGYM
jgi:YqjK-like protein